MKKIHVAISVKNLAKSVQHYNEIFEMEPTVMVPGLYALWKSDIIHFSITQNKEAPGTLKHLGFEDIKNCQSTEFVNTNKIVWERFSPEPQFPLVTNFSINNSKIRIH